MVNLNKILAKILSTCSLVVEKGTSDNWTYMKWSDGTAECWGTFSGTLSHYGTWHNAYGYYRDISFPTNLFNSTPVVTYSAKVGSGFALSGVVTGSLTKSVNRYFALSSASGSQTCYWSIHAIGTWK